MKTVAQHELPSTVEPYFRAWIDLDTWHTSHDLERFYKFVWAVHRYCRPRKGSTTSRRRLPSDTTIRLAIIEARKHSFDNEYLLKVAERYSSLYNHLLDFADTPNYPDHLIEKKHILRYYFQLEQDLGGFKADASAIAHRMKRDWGDDWQEQLDKEKRRLG